MSSSSIAAAVVADGAGAAGSAGVVGNDNDGEEVGCHFMHPIAGMDFMQVRNAFNEV